MSGKKKTIIIVALLLVVFIGSISYALWSVTLEQTDSNVVKTGCFTVDMVEQTDEINLPEEYPVKDEDGRKYSPFTFTIQNTCTIDSSYSVNLKVDSSSTLEHQYVKAVLDGDKAQVLTDYEKATNEDKYQLTTGTLAGASAEGAGDGESVTYNLRLWLDADTPETQMSKDFYAKIVIENITTSGVVAREALVSFDLSFNPEHGDDVMVTYFNNGDVEVVGTGEMEHGQSIISYILQAYMTTDTELSEIASQIGSLSESAQGLISVAGNGSFGGYRTMNSMTEGLADFSDVTNNEEFYDVLIQAINDNSSLFTETDLELLPGMLKTITTKIKPITKVTLTEGITYIADYAFQYFGQIDIVLPSTVEELGEKSFTDSDFESIALNDGLKIIGISAFSGSLITDVEIPESVTSIDYSAFQGSKIETITIPANASVNGQAFQDCSELKTVIWNTTAGIPGAAFTNASNLTSVIINTEIPYIAINSFDQKDVNPNLVLKFKMSEDKKTNIIESISGRSFDFTNYNVEWGYAE